MILAREQAGWGKTSSLSLPATMWRLDCGEYRWRLLYSRGKTMMVRLKGSKWVGHMFWRLNQWYSEELDVRRKETLPKVILEKRHYWNVISLWITFSGPLLLSSGEGGLPKDKDCPFCVTMDCSSDIMRLSCEGNTWQFNPQRLECELF